MSSPIALLPEPQLRPLLDAYEAQIRSRRWHTLLVLACIVVAVVLSGISAEVSLGKLFDNIHRFPSYIIRLFQLENGRPVWTDPGEWFWGLPRCCDCWARPC